LSTLNGTSSRPNVVAGVEHGEDLGWAASMTFDDLAWATIWL